MVDITAQKEVEERLRTSNDELGSSLRTQRLNVAGFG